MVDIAFLVLLLFLELLAFFVDEDLGAGFFELDLGLVVVLRVEAGALVEAEAFFDETLEDIETFFDDTEALMDDTLDEADAFLDETLLETEGFWGPLDETAGLDETEALVAEALTETLEDEDEDAFLEETLAETELFLEETDALMEETLDDTDASLRKQRVWGQPWRRPTGLSCGWLQ